MGITIDKKIENVSTPVEMKPGELGEIIDSPIKHYDGMIVQYIEQLDILFAIGEKHFWTKPKELKFKVKLLKNESKLLYTVQ